MKKRIYCITTALCLVLCIVLCIAFAAVCSKAENSKTLLPEVRNNGTAIQWKYSDEADWHDLVALTELRGAAYFCRLAPSYCKHAAKHQKSGAKRQKCTCE